jgi:hypothetical protein
MNDYSNIFRLLALGIKQEKLFETIQLHDQLKDAEIKAWEIAELARTQIEYTQLKNTIDNNGKDQTNQNNSK